MTTAEPTPQTQVWEALKILREKDGHTIASLAAATPYTPKYLYALENGTRRPTPAVIHALAKALNVPKSMLEAPPTQGRVRETLTVLREKSGYKVSDLARITPFTREYIRLLETGRRRFTPAVINALAEALNVPKSMLEAPETGPQVWEALRNIRRERDLTQEEVAELTPFTSQYIQQLETGRRRPTPAVINALAEALNVPKSMLEAPRSEGDAA